MSLTLEAARHVIAAAQSFDGDDELVIAVVVVDSGGHVVAVERADGAPFVAVALAEEKARTAAAFGTPTRGWRDLSRPGDPYWGMASALGGRLSVLPGGVPLVVEGAVVGAVGVSGGTDDQDHACAAHAARQTGPISDR